MMRGKRWIGSYPAPLEKKRTLTPQIWTKWTNVENLESGPHPGSYVDIQKLKVPMGAESKSSLQGAHYFDWAPICVELALHVWACPGMSGHVRASPDANAPLRAMHA